MTSCCGYFQSAFGCVLAYYLGEVHYVRLWLGGFIVLFCRGPVSDKQICAVFLSGKDAQDLFEVLDSVDFDVAVFDSLQGGVQRQNAAAELFPVGKLDYRQGPGDVTYATVQSELSHYHVLLQKWQLALLGGGNDAQGDRDVVAASFLVHVCRSEVDDDLFSRYAQAQRLQGGDGSQQTFLDGGVCKTDQMDAESGGDADLDKNRYSIDSDALGAMNVDEHGTIKLKRLNLAQILADILTMCLKKRKMW